MSFLLGMLCHIGEQRQIRRQNKPAQLVRETHFGHVEESPSNQNREDNRFCFSVKPGQHIAQATSRSFIPRGPGLWPLTERDSTPTRWLGDQDTLAELKHMISLGGGHALELLPRDLGKKRDDVVESDKDSSRWSLCCRKQRVDLESLDKDDGSIRRHSRVRFYAGSIFGGLRKESIHELFLA